MRENVCPAVVAMVLFAPGCSASSVSPPVAQSAAAVPWFTDAAGASALDFVHFNGMSGGLFMAEILGPGVALFDYDNDGDLDVFVTQGQMLGAGRTLAQALFPPRTSQPLTGRLYRNDLAVHADGTRTVHFTDVTGERHRRQRVRHGRRDGRLRQ
jgi:hypothetical protein